jgi:hypothetical protein
MALTAKTLKKEGLSVSINPDVFVKSELDRTTISNNLKDTIKVPQWKRVEVEDRGKKKMVMRVIDNEMRKDEFLNYLESQKQEFAEHVSRVKTQYAQIRLLKQTLPENHVIIHMDFAENYACRSSEEIQSAYFNQTGVTLHPVVIYYTENNILCHKSIVMVSDTTMHNAHTVLAFLDVIIKEVKSFVPKVQVCHYWTDSPTSQYRNKLIFDTVANHSHLYGCSARWNYFESGHGKGPCDGLGGTVKRMADTAIKTSKVVIQDALDFFKWANEKSSFVNVIFKYVPDTDITIKISSLEGSQSLLRPVKGTMKLHAVVGTGNSNIFVRETSCYCVRCLTDEMCDTWRKETTRKLSNAVESKEPTEIDQTQHSEVKKNTAVEVKKGQYVAAVYDSKWYIGVVTDVDEAEKDVEISFMEKKKQFYQWPQKEDKIWIDEKSILGIVDKPTETGKSKRMYKLTDVEFTRCTNLFSAYSSPHS